MAQFKQKCGRCKTNYVIVTSRNAYGAVCFECQKKELAGEIKEPAMKRLFDIPEDYYMKSGFLRNIKVNYLKYGQLSDKQVEVFKKVVKDLSEKKAE